MNAPSFPMPAEHAVAGRADLGGEQLAGQDEGRDVGAELGEEVADRVD